MSSKAEKFYQRHLKKKGIHARMSRNAQARDPNSLRNRLGVILWRSKAEMLKEIKRRTGCDDVQAVKSFKTAKDAEPRIIVHDKPSNTWATTEAAKDFAPPSKRIVRTDRQREHWEDWEYLPGKQNDKDKERSEVYAWAVNRGIAATVDEAKTKYHGANNCTDIPEIDPFYAVRQDGRKLIYGKNYYLPGTVRDASVMTFERMVDAFRVGYAKRIGVSVSELAGFEPEKLVGQAIACGDLVAINIKPDPFYFGWQSLSLIGADKLAKQQQEEAERIARAEVDRLAAEAEKEEKERERVERMAQRQEDLLAVWLEQLKDSQSLVSRTIKMMPFVDTLSRGAGEDNFDAAETWIMFNIGFWRDGNKEYMRITDQQLAGRIIYCSKDLGYVAYSEERDCHYGVSCEEIKPASYTAKTVFTGKATFTEKAA